MLLNLSVNKLKLFSISLLTFSLLGCASYQVYNPATQKKEFIFISTEQEVSMGRDAHKELLKEFKFSNDQRDINRLNRIGQRLAIFSDRNDYVYNFYLIDKDEINAFTTPGGNIYMFSGLMGRLSSDDQVAAVLSHEIGHCAARHVVKKFQAALGYNLVGGIVSSAAGAESKATQVLQGTGAVMGLVFKAYGRQDEFEADRLSMKYLDLGGFDPYAMIETLEVLKRESKGNLTPVMLRTHPHADERIKQAKEEILKYTRSNP